MGDRRRRTRRGARFGAFGVAVSLGLAPMACVSVRTTGVPPSRLPAGTLPPEAAESAPPQADSVRAAHTEQDSEVERAWVIFGSDTVRAEVARTAEARRQGLMFRDSVPPGTGMLFVFDEPAIRSFWMRNTQVPLDIAFIDEELRVVEIERMEAETTDLHAPDEPVLYALEVPAGWFAGVGVRAGDRALIVLSSTQEPGAGVRRPSPGARPV